MAWTTVNYDKLFREHKWVLKTFLKKAKYRVFFQHFSNVASKIS